MERGLKSNILTQYDSMDNILSERYKPNHLVLEASSSGIV